MNKSKGLLVIYVLLSIFIVLAGVVYSNARVENMSKRENKSRTSKSSTQKAVTALFLTQESPFLSEKISETKLKNAKNQVTATKNATLLAKFTEAKEKFALQNQINQLFQEKVMVGSRVKEAGKLKKISQLENVEKVEKIVNELHYQDAFKENSEQALAMAREQVATPKLKEELEKAQALVYAIVQNQIIIREFTLEEYMTAKTAVNSLTEGEDKQKLQWELAMVEESLDNMGIVYE